MIRFSLATFGVKTLWVLREWSNTLVIGKISGQVATIGLYSMAEELALTPGSKISAVVNMLSSPVMAELQRDIDAMRAAFYRAVRLTAAIAVPASAGISLVADEMVTVLLGPKWLASVPVLRLLCVYGAVPRRRCPAAAGFVRAAPRGVLGLVLCCAVDRDAGRCGHRRAMGWSARHGRVLDAGLLRGHDIHGPGGIGGIEGWFSELWSQLWPIFAATAAMVAVVLLLAVRRRLDGPNPRWFGWFSYR